VVRSARYSHQVTQLNPESPCFCFLAAPSSLHSGREPDLMTARRHEVAKRDKRGTVKELEDYSMMWNSSEMAAAGFQTASNFRNGTCLDGVHSEIHLQHFAPTRGTSRDCLAQ
jgi:hypothetical protein